MMQSMILTQALNQLAESIHKTAIDKGWWKERDALQAIADKNGMGDYARTQIEGTLVALHHSELSEALDGARGGNPPDDKIPEFSAMEAELADCIIRILDHAARYKYRVAEAIVCKVKFNEGRSHKHGGKAF